MVKALQSQKQAIAVVVIVFCRIQLYKFISVCFSSQMKIKYYELLHQLNRFIKFWLHKNFGRFPISHYYYFHLFKKSEY